MSIRRTAAVALLALAASGCASTEDYGDMRRSRFDHTYRGGAAMAPAPAPSLTEPGDAAPVEVLGAFIYVAAIVLGWTGHASVNCSSPPR